MKLLDNTGLGYLITKMKAAFWPKSDVVTMTFADVATTGSYNDLLNKPTIPSVDSNPTSGSTNAVSSGGVASALSGKQATLVSGTNIKTINSTSLLGSGDIAVSANTPKATTIPAGGMLPNVYYALGTLTGSVTLSMASPTESGILNQYFFTFDTGSTAPTITWSNLITSWFGGSAPTINSSKHYEVSVIDGVGVCMEV